MPSINDLFCKDGDRVTIEATNFHASKSRTKLVEEKFTSTNNRYATAQEVLLEYGALDNDYQDEVTFQTWLEERLHSSTNVA